ncbi:MAG: phosphoribosylformylglycinamidine synthase subunit PurS [Chloroflexi bacterium]|nr:phosphoribosylformylglycinamidine synthase subunit PurS [Chloroflexota bacterium]MCY3938472.1 phosphoribosylformylglycinamidine synthase subunit PurS [Chloroflexota bacterium]
MSRKTYEVAVVIRPLAEVVDPEGETIHAGLRDLGYAGVSRVRAGKLIELDIEAAGEDEAAALAKDMSDRLLANPVIEQFEVTVREARQAPA